MPRGLSPAVTAQSPNVTYSDNPYVYQATTPRSAQNVIVIKPGNVYSTSTATTPGSGVSSLTNLPTISPIVVSDASNVCTAFTPHGHNYSADYSLQLSQKPQVTIIHLIMI